VIYDRLMKWRRTAIVIFLTLAPWPAVWYGMYELRSVLWTFVLYHGLCLLPAIIWGRSLWQSHVLWPSGRQWLLVLSAAVFTSVVGVAAYIYTGEMVVSRAHVLDVLTTRGFLATYLLPLAIYFVVVNAILEELFWRGTVLNELEYLDKPGRMAGTLWTAMTFAAWHYLVLKALLQPGFAELGVAGILGLGVFTSWLYRRTQSIVLPILVHALVFDLAAIVLFVVLLKT
jgi:membrane protease YdiL (CAAX protease family)